MAMIDGADASNLSSVHFSELILVLNWTIICQRI